MLLLTKVHPHPPTKKNDLAQGPDAGGSTPDLTTASAVAAPLHIGEGNEPLSA